MRVKYDFRNERRDDDGNVVAVDVVRTDKDGEKTISQNYNYSESHLIIEADKIATERDIYKRVVMAAKNELYTLAELRALARDAIGIAENLK